MKLQLLNEDYCQILCLTHFTHDTLSVQDTGFNPMKHKYSYEQQLDNKMVLLVVFPVVPVEDASEERADVSVPGQCLFNKRRLCLTSNIYFNIMAAHFCLSYVFTHIKRTFSQVIGFFNIEMKLST